MWEVNEIKKEEQQIKKIRTAISGFLVLLGIVLLTTQLVPLISSYIRAELLKSKETSIKSPLPGSFRKEIDGEFAYWDPGKSYFENLTRSVSSSTTGATVYNPETGDYQEVVIDSSYKKPLLISIPSLGINNLNVTPNVDSFDEKVYNEILTKGLAHFKGTSLPGDGGNSFIYGHSAVTSFYNNHKNNPEIAFTILENIKIGDKIMVKKENKTYTYIVRKKKIVTPEDFSVLSRQSYKETITLMTCSPVGIGTDRLIITAEIIDG